MEAAVKMCRCATWPGKPLAGHFGQFDERCSAVIVCCRYSRKNREVICAEHGVRVYGCFGYLWMCFFSIFLVLNKDDFQASPRHAAEPWSSSGTAF